MVSTGHKRSAIKKFIILACVKSSPLKLQRNILRFLTIFETQLKTYDEHFNNDYYQMSYVVHRCLFTGDFTVETTMTIWNKKYFFDRIETTYQFLSSLKSFCAVFSIQEVRIVRQWKKPTNHSLNLEERIGYGLYEKTIN
jgi:hypothetical protein